MHISQTSKKFSAFTLAEVLITLGIIGVVAAMTIPTLIANTNGIKYRTTYKKMLSTLNQAVKMSVANYDYDFATISSDCKTEADNPETTQSICGIFNGALSGTTLFDYTQLYLSDGKTLYYKDVYAKTTTDTNLKNRGIELYTYTMKDGSLISFHSEFKDSEIKSIACTLNNKTLKEALKDEDFVKYCVAWIDVNGTSLPNKEVRCSDNLSHSKDIDAECIVPNKTNFLGDIFPIAIHDATVEPASAAARYLLNTTK